MRVYLRAKFEVSSIILTSFWISGDGLGVVVVVVGGGGGGGAVILPDFLPYVETNR